MSLTDINGRSWARLSELKPGDRLKADGGFTCLNDGEICEVLWDSEGDPFINCAGPDSEEAGSLPRIHQHILYGQLDDEGDALVGLYPVPRP